jgi:hypothetical protein
MTMFYSDSETRFLNQQAYDREIEKQKKIIEDAERHRKAFGLSRKEVPVKKFCASHA